LTTLLPQKHIGNIDHRHTCPEQNTDNGARRGASDARNLYYPFGL
jgi:hypothetical protein